MAAARQPTTGSPAAIASLTLPGIRLVHDGQMQGHRRHLPVQLVRAPAEQTDEALALFYSRLLEVAGRPALQRGAFELRDVRPAGDDSHGNLVAWTWSPEGLPTLVVINQSGVPARGRISLPELPDTLPGVRWVDPLDPGFVEAPLVEVRGEGFLVELAPWGGRVLEATAAV